jgi:hypothetical protein
MNPQERLQKFIEENIGSRKPSCGQCNHWKVDKTDEIQRRHAAQGRALCVWDKRLDRPFLHHKSPACEKISMVDLDTEIKRMKYLEGK